MTTTQTAKKSTRKPRTPALPANIVELAERTKPETPAAAKRRIAREQAAADKVAASMAEFKAAHEPVASTTVAVWGPNLMAKTAETFHVHAVDCPDTRKGVYRKHTGWTVAVDNFAEVVESIYSDIIAENPDETWETYASDVKVFPCAGIAGAPEAPAKPAKPARKETVKKRDTSIKTWTLAGIQVRAAAAEIKTRMGDEAKGARFEIGTRSKPVYATTLAEAKVTPKGDDLVERYSIENGTNLPEVRGHGYVAHLYVSKRGEHVSTWTVWLPAEGFVLLTADGKAVK